MQSLKLSPWIASFSPNLQRCPFKVLHDPRGNKHPHSLLTAKRPMLDIHPLLRRPSEARG